MSVLSLRRGSISATRRRAAGSLPVESLVDRFDATSLNTAIWTQGVGGTTTMSYATTGASIVLPSAATTSDYGQIVAAATYDLTGSSISVHVVTPPNAATQAYATLQMTPNWDDNVRWTLQGGTLSGTAKVATVDHYAVGLTYNSSTHAYWRISENAGVLTWWTSADNVTWTSQATFTHGMASITNMHVALQLACFQAETSPGTFKWNLLNSGGLSSYPGWWYSTLQGVPLGDMGTDLYSGTATANALRQQWDYWDNAGGSAVSAAAEGIPAQPDGDTIIKWYKAAGGTNEYQKLNRTLTNTNWPGAAGYPPLTGTSPPDISARYIIRFYIPSNRFTLNPSHGWLIFTEMKEDYQDASNVWHQDPVWQVMVNNYSGSGTNSVFLWGGTHNYPGTPNPSYPLTQFVDKWLTWELRLYQGSADTSGHGGRIEWWSDGVLMDTGYESEIHVGSVVFAPDLAHTNNWRWIAGQYSSNQGTDYMGQQVTTYVGSSYLLPLSTV